MTSGAKPTFIPGAVPGAHRSDAVEQSSSIPHLLSSAILHQQNGRLTEASQIYRQILAIDPHHADSLHLLGVVECQSGHLEVAANLIRSAIAIHRTSAFYYSNLGIVLHAQGNLEEAAIRYRQALVLKPGMAEVHLNLGNILKVQNKPEESIACYQQAIVCNPTLAEAFNNLGTIYQSQDRLDEAVASYQHALTLSPDYAKPHNNLGAIHQSQNQLEEAVACYQRAIALDPAYAQAFYNLGRVLTAQGHLDDALLQYKTALTLDPTYGQAAFSESLTQLLQADFAVGWPNFENRWRSIDHKTPMRPYPQPLWTGHALSSGRLLLWGEQGVGDEILFASLIPDLLRNRIPCLLDCDRRLQPLFARSFPSIEVIAAPDLEAAPIADSEAGSAVAPAPDITFHLPTGSLPHLLRPNLVSFSNTTSYSIIRTLTMVMGEMDSSRMGLENDSVTNYLIYFMFIAVMCIIVLNLVSWDDVKTTKSLIIIFL